jgi:deoxyribodipyrimidine photo-lyase
MGNSLWWIRRDLRLADNLALGAALDHGGAVLPVFVIDPALRASRYWSARRWVFLLGGLRALDADLRARGSRLTVRHGRPRDVLRGLLAEASADEIFAEADYSPYARRRDEAIAADLPLTLVDGLTVQPPGAVLKTDGTPYTVFTPFSRAWKALPTRGDLRPAPKAIPTPPDIPSDPIPAMPAPENDGRFPPGEVEAARRLSAFTRAKIGAYAQDRDRMDLDGTSSLSPYLRFGMLSAQRAVDAARRAMHDAPNKDALHGAERWLDELIWREFYVHILAHFPHVRREAFRPALRNIPWRNDASEFQAWCEGRTGYPVVDAGLRHLIATGWMHNRARMIVASFLTKDLLIDWRWGETFFMQHLVDGDPAANNGGWQWSAGTGTDAAPYFRIFNPVLQGQKFDPEGAYVRRWVSELASLPDRAIHVPWKLSAAEQRRYGVVIGRDYPDRIVDHRDAREATLRAYGAAAKG